VLSISFLGAINLLFSGYSKVNSHHYLKDSINKIVLFQEEQLNHLEALSLDLTTLKQGPMFSAKIFLQDAMKHHRTEKESNELIDKAKEKFIDALGILEAKGEKVFSDYLQIGTIQYFISLCWLLMLKKEDANDWLKLALETIRINQIKLEIEIQNDKDYMKKIIQEREKIGKGLNKKMAVGIFLGTFTISPFLAVALTAPKSHEKKVQLLLTDYSKYEQKISKNQRLNKEALLFHNILLQTKDAITNGEDTPKVK
jgi:hypothetical protein